jgi:hypothetical protein
VLVETAAVDLDGPALGVYLHVSDFHLLLGSLARST